VRVGPVRLVGQGLASPAAVKRAALAGLGLAGVLGLVLVAAAEAWWWLVVGAACLAAAWLYTGGPRPYGYAGLGEVFVFVFFGPVAVVGTASTQTGELTWFALAVSLPIGILAALILVANNLRDIPTDIEAGKRTLAVVLGDAASRQLFVLGCLTAYALVCAVALVNAGALVGLLGAVPAWRAARTVAGGASGRDLIPVLGATSLALLLTGLGLGVGLAALG